MELQQRHVCVLSCFTVSRYRLFVLVAVRCHWWCLHVTALFQNCLCITGQIELELSPHSIGKKYWLYCRDYGTYPVTLGEQWINNGMASLLNMAKTFLHETLIIGGIIFFSSRTLRIFISIRIYIILFVPQLFLLALCQGKVFSTRPVYLTSRVCLYIQAQSD